MKERVLIAIKDEGLLEESTEVLYKHDYLVTKASNLSDMESHLNSTPQDVILLDISIWKEKEPDLPSRLIQSHSEASIIHLVSNGDQDILEGIVKNGEEGGHLLQPVTGKEVLVMVDQVIRNKQLQERFKQMRSELLEANKNLSNKTKEFQELIAFHKDILQNSTVGIITIDTRYIITSWNQCASHITGIKKSVAMGSNLFDIIPILGWEKVLERVKAVIQKTEVTELGHLETKRPEGDNIYANYKFSPIRKENEILGAVIIVEDISRKIHLQKELDRAHGYIGHLVENSADAIISTDLDGTIVTWNKGAETMFGFSAQAAIGRPWNFLAAENDRKKLQNLFQWVKKSGAISNFLAEIITMSGEPLPISLTISLIKDNDGHVYGISGIFKDLSEAKKIKKQMIQSQRMISLGAMATSMAHDINDPLASLSTYTHLLMTRTKGFGIAQLTDNLAKVEEDADKIGQMVKDLLWYATPSDHALGKVDIHEILKKSLSFTAYQVNMQNIEVKKDLSAKESQLMANSKELIQALINILTNAVESMSDGGIMTIQTKSADEIAPENEEKGILIEIRDTGIGIPEENLSRIFEQFFTTRSDERGNGLGLYVARAIIEDHHGTIEVESEIDKGTCFTIRLPLRIEI